MQKMKWLLGLCFVQQGLGIWKQILSAQISKCIFQDIIYLYYISIEK